MNSKLLNSLKKKFYEIINDYDGYSIQKCANFKNFTESWISSLVNIFSELLCSIKSFGHTNNGVGTNLFS